MSAVGVRKVKGMEFQSIRIRRSSLYRMMVSMQ